MNRTGPSRADWKHGESKPPTAEYRAWLGVMTRSVNGFPKQRKSDEKWYSTVTVCEEWKDYRCFLRDVGRKPSPKHSIDRIDGTRGYEPGNVRWATPTEQSRNISQNHRITINGETKCTSEWAEIYGISPKTIRVRLHRGWDEVLAVTKPPETKYASK